MTKSKLLVGIDQISEYLQISRNTFYEFVGSGMPARVINRRWYAHSDNLDEFFRGLTRHREKMIDEEAE